jgi:hypothetical protein
MSKFTLPLNSQNGDILEASKKVLVELMSQFLSNTTKLDYIRI